MEREKSFGEFVGSGRAKPKLQPNNIQLNLDLVRAYICARKDRLLNVYVTGLPDDYS
jgi:hypothetical protein